MIKMTNDFTYEKPDEKAFLGTLIKYLRFKGETEIAGLTQGSQCQIETSSSYSYQRWDALWTRVVFYVPVEKLEKVNDEIKVRLVGFCNDVIPANAGLDIMKVEFAPLILKVEDSRTLIEDLELTISSLSEEIISQILPEDMKTKGKDMAEAYLYLYCVENSLRLFIDKVARESFGSDSFSRLNLNRDIRDSISQRKRDEDRNQWLRLRGDSEVFYLDFKDLGRIIENNWTIFSSYFPDIAWISTKIKELAKCRNLVAHNSNIGDHEKNVIRVNYTSILRQLGITMR